MVLNDAASSPRRVKDRLMERIVALAFWTLSLVCLLNLNDLARMLTGIERAFTPAILFCCLVALAGLWRVGLKEALGTSGMLILSTLGSYAAVGIVVSILTGNDHQSNAAFYLERHLASMLLIAAAAVGARVVGTQIGEERLLRALLVMMAGSCVLIPATPWLMEVYLLPPAEGESRFSGSFSNPNDAGLFACLTVALALSFIRGGRFRPVADGVLLAAVAALVLTLSRTALIILPALVAHGLLASRGIEQRRLLGVLALAGGVVLAGASTRLDTSVLDDLQLTRWRSLLQIIDNRAVDDVTLGGRLTLWRVAWDMVLEAPLFGHGLGRLHHLEDGYYNDVGVLLGAHNQYLVLVGEAGFVPLVLFLLFLWTMARGSHRQALPGATNGWALVLAMFSLTADGILTLRTCNLLIGVACAASGGRLQRRPLLVPPASGTAERTEVRRKPRVAISSTVMPPKRASPAK